MSDSKYIFEYREIHKDDISQVGKAGVLAGNLVRAGIPLPGGFVVTSYAYNFFLDQNHGRSLNRAAIPQELAKQITKRYEKIGSFFRHAKVKVITDSYVSFTDIFGEANLINKIRECWALGLKTVLVQEQLKPEIEGLAYTAVEKGIDRHKIIAKTPQSLDEEKKRELERLVKEIHKSHFFPQEICWIYSRNKPYIVWLRPKLSGVSLSLQRRDELPKGDLAKTGDLLVKGMGGSWGVATGTVKVIENARKDKVGWGEVLVVKSFREDFIPALKNVAAVVADEGKVNTNVSIISSELKIPFVMGAKYATKILKNGMVVTVYGKSGEVFWGKPEKTFAVPGQTRSTAYKQGLATKVFLALKKPSDIDSLSSELNGAIIFKNFGNVGSLTKVCKHFYPAPVIFQVNNFLKKKSLFEEDILTIAYVRKTYQNLYVAASVHSPQELLILKRGLALKGLVRGNTLKLFLTLKAPSNVISLKSFVETGIDGVILDLKTFDRLFSNSEPEASHTRIPYSQNNALLWAVGHLIRNSRRFSIPTIIYEPKISHYHTFLEYLVQNGVWGIATSPKRTKKLESLIYEYE